MKNLFLLFISVFIFSNTSTACSMYKITNNGKTIVGNNEDWHNPNTQMWFEPGTGDEYGVMNVGFNNNFAQGGINEAGLMFDGFAMPYLEVKNTEGKTKMRLGEMMGKVMHTYAKVEEVKDFLSTVDLSGLATGMIVFVDKAGKYLIVEGDELILGNEAEQSFSNFYPSQTKAEEASNLEFYQKGLKYIKNSKSTRSVDYCSSVMKNLAQDRGTQYSTIYDLDKLVIRMYHYQNFEHSIDIDLKAALKKGKHTVSIPELFPKDTKGYAIYAKYNNPDKPESYVQEAWETDSKGKTGEELEQFKQGFASYLNSIGYEWLYDKKDAKGAAAIFKYGTELLPDNANLYDSYGEALFANKEYEGAIKNYKKSLALNPDNSNATKMLAEIKAAQEQANAPSELELIRNTLLDYLEGTANGEPERIKRAFHKDLNLYTVENDSLRTRSGQKYISYFKEGQKSNRIGRIIAMDYENDAATAKIEILMPSRKRIYTDYLLLLKVEGHWKIIHKSYTFREYPQ